VGQSGGQGSENGKNDRAPKDRAFHENSLREC
jgi:hypothetical protein